ALDMIPTYNWDVRVRQLVLQLLEQEARLDVLMVDDGSPDGAGQIADSMARANPRVHALQREAKLGLGTAYITGFKWALERGYDYVFEMDADFSHDPKHLKEFLTAIQDADVVLGSRYLDGKVTIVNWPMSRLMLSYFANIYARWFTGVGLWDLTGGFKCFRRRVLESIDLSQVGSN